MARVIFENLTMKQAKELANWYEGQGEQDAQVWFEEKEVDVPTVDVHKKDCIKTVGDTVTVKCH